MNSQTNLNQYTKSIRLTNQAKLLVIKLKEINLQAKHIQEEIKHLQKEAHKIQLNVIPSHPWTPSGSRLKEKSHENKHRQTLGKKQIKRLQVLAKKLNWGKYAP